MLCYATEPRHITPNNLSSFLRVSLLSPHMRSPQSTDQSHRSIPPNGGYFSPPPFRFPFLFGSRTLLPTVLLTQSQSHGTLLPNTSYPPTRLTRPRTRTSRSAVRVVVPRLVFAEEVSHESTHTGRVTTAALRDDIPGGTADVLVG